MNSLSACKLEYTRVYFSVDGYIQTPLGGLARISVESSDCAANFRLSEHSGILNKSDRLFPLCYTSTEQ